MRILLIQPCDASYKYRGYFSRPITYAPITLPILAALVPKDLDAEITICDEGVQPANYSLDSWDVVGISGVTSSITRGFELADRFRERGTHVVMGGAFTSLNPDLSAEHADTVVAGYAERVFPEILRTLANGGRPEKIYIEKAPRFLSAPPARRDLIPWGRYIPVATVQASRGCSHTCHYCSVPRQSSGSPCFRPVDEVIDEVRGLRSKRVLFFDPNISLEKEYSSELFEKLIPLNRKWAAAATVDFPFDRELFDLAVRSGLMGLLIGFESMDQVNMNSCGKPFNEVSRYKESVKLCHDRHVGVLGTFIVGFDGDTPRVFDDLAEFVDEIEIDIPRFAVLTPFPGTPLFNRLKHEGRILTENWQVYDSIRVVFTPDGMSVSDLQRGILKVWQNTFKSSRILKRALRAKWMPMTNLGANLIFMGYAKTLPALVNRPDTPVYSRSVLDIS